MSILDTMLPHRPAPDGRVTRRLSLNTSLYLDALRLAAAFAVFLGHSKVLFFPALRLGPLFGQAREAVAVFFVLSGFVIRFVTEEKEGDWTSYLVARCSRIYSVALVAVVLTLVADKIGSSWNAAYYDSLDFYVPASLGSALQYLTFTNQLWFSHVIYGTDEPYWSLGFEVWYYVLFALAVFLPSRARIAAITLWLFICGPKIAAYLPLWLIGVAAYGAYSSYAPKWRRATACAVYVSTFPLYAAICFVLSKQTGNMYTTYDLLQEILNLGYFTAIGLLVAVNILAFDAVAGPRPVLGAKAAKTLRWLAGASFTLYLMHQPLLIMISSLIPSSRTSATVGAACCAVTLLLVLLIAELGERRKKLFSRLFQPLAGLARP